MHDSRSFALLAGVVSLVSLTRLSRKAARSRCRRARRVGDDVEVAWQGAADARDFITMVPSDAPEGRYLAYQYTSKSPVTLKAPQQYEIRYLTGQSYATLAAAAVMVTPVSATLAAPPSAPARSVVTVTWEGPGNPTDHVILLPATAPNDASGNYAYVSRGKELRIATPAEPGAAGLRRVVAARVRSQGGRLVSNGPRDSGRAVEPRRGRGESRVDRGDESREDADRRVAEADGRGSRQPAAAASRHHTPSSMRAARRSLRRPSTVLQSKSRPAPTASSCKPIRRARSTPSA